MVARQIWPLQVWQSGTNENSLPANDNALTVQVVADSAIGFANSEPLTPSEDDQYVIGTSWGGFTKNNVVIYKSGTWIEFEAFDGWLKSIGTSAYLYQGSSWDEVSGSSSSNITIISESSAYDVEPSTHSGIAKIINSAGSATFDSAQSYLEGQCYNIRATASISLIESGVTLEPNSGGTLSMTSGMTVTVVMTSATTGFIIGQTVPA
jgi:hypothetical protein